ncbi:MAG: hypothetical protein QE279_05835 [Rhodoferax sp.]|nr:hypothetical protein [Rhodoferax sp.]
MQKSLSFETEVSATPEAAWVWITSFDGISKEMSPLVHMSAPKGVKDLSSVTFESGVPMFRSWITLFGVLPIDYSNLTLLTLNPGFGFVEQSPMGSMKLWRHERQIVALDAGCKITDTLTFEPRFAGRLISGIVEVLFTHRHKMLSKYLGVYAADPSLKAHHSDGRRP